MRLGRLAGAVAALVLAAIPGSPAAAAGTYPPGVTVDTMRIASAGTAAVAAGGAHSCMITSLGDVYCWGNDSSGQLGDGARRHGFAEPVKALRNAVRADAGRAHTCAIDTGGTAYCWGDDSAGQLGDGAHTDRDAPHPVEALRGRTLVMIATGSRHTCAADDEGAAWCWGDGSRGQLGVPGTSRSATPVRVRTGGRTDEIVDIAAGGDTTCVATAGGSVYCWGADPAGGEERSAPAAVTTGGKVREVAAGGRQACALDADGAAYCWGATARRAGPFAAISAGAAHACGIDRGGRAYCWGDGGGDGGGGGRLGHGRTAGRTAPTGVEVDAELTGIDAGSAHSCAVDARGYTFCWGSGADGQLGAGGTAFSAVPVRVEGLPRAPAAATGVQVRALDGGLRVSWRPPADLGSGQFEYVWVTTAGHEAGCTLPALTAQGCDLTGLRNGQEYDVAVVVKTSDGMRVGDFVTATPVAVAPDPLGAAPPRRELQPGAGGGLPLTGLSPVALVAIGTMLLGGGLVALLVRAPQSPAPRRGTVRRRP
ncbi:hypothetical protein [Couchioplanes caeruleus]|uniref:Fibronectin type-III domain-containing protein n=1 Tax=Couchioplanes caeruleus subsp. caeruleus TaxID=56427 RepID=A0A1K0FE69_9ACTN|nr:hypothetical protein [Couchioplanes caeruleus]OJF11032.1 hypothetical protein BG844_28825 [Couchioplanes caeruleus subsp. caeruleus]